MATTVQQRHRVHRVHPEPEPYLIDWDEPGYSAPSPLARAVIVSDRLLYKAWCYRRDREAAAKLDDAVATALEWAILQFTRCLLPGEAEAAPPLSLRYPRGKFPKFPRPPDVAAELPKHPAGEHRRRRAAELLAAGRITSEVAARIGARAYGR